MNQANLMQQMKRMQQEMAKAQEDLENTVVTGSAGGGSVTVRMSCAHRVKEVKIAAEAVDPSDVETLEDLLVAALNDALKTIEETAQARMGQVTGGLRIPGL